MGQLSFGSPISARVGQCSSPLAIQVRDNFGNMSSLTMPLQVGLSSSSNTTQFFASTDSSCSTPLMPSVLVLPAGANSGAFRFKDTVPGMPIFTAMSRDAGPEAPMSGSQDQEIF